MPPTPYTIDRVIRLVVTLGFIAAGIWLLGYLSDVLIPFIIAFLCAYLLNPLVCRVQKKLRHRGISIFVVITGVICLTVIIGLITIPRISHEVSHMGELLGKFADDSDVKKRASEILPAPLLATLKDRISKEKMLEIMHKEKFWVFVQGLARKILPKAWDIFRGTANFVIGLLGIFIIGLYLVFLLLDYDKFREEWENLIPKNLRQQVIDFIDDVDKSMNRYFRAQAVVAACIGTIFAIGFGLIGLPLGILLGLILGLLNMVPYLQIVGIFPAIVMALLKSLETGGNFWLSIGLVLVVFIVAQIIQDVVLVPKIMGELTGLSPAMILLSISIWGKLLGFLGLVIAIPMTCLCLAYYHRFLEFHDTETAHLTDS